MVIISAEKLKEFYFYCPNTGIFTRKKPILNFNIGDISGSKDGRGYLRMSIDNQRYWAHRLAWLYMTGEYPNDAIDHIDGNKSNNSFNNLRLANKSQNGCNRSKPSNNTSGIKNIRFCNQRNKWIAQVQFKGKNYARRFNNLDDAQKHTIELRQKLHGEFAHA